MDIAENKAPPKVATPELRLEDIGATDREGNAHQQANAIIAAASRKLVAHVATLKHLQKCKSVVTLKITIAHMPDAQGKSSYAAMCQAEVKTPAPLPKLDVLKNIEVSGRPTLARGYPEDEGDELPFGDMTK